MSLPFLAVDDGRHPSCADLPDPDVMFPKVGGRPVPPDIARMCANCPLRQPCLEYALREPVDGIWGGTTAKQRRRMNHNLPAYLTLGALERKASA